VTSTRAIENVVVFGGGAWGTALALVAARAGRQTTLWLRDPDVAAAIRDHGRNERALPAIRLDRSFAVSTDLAVAAKADLVVVTVPAQSAGGLLRALAPFLSTATPVLVAAKGLEHGTRALMTEVVAREIPGAIPAILSGPSFADDVARLLPTAVTIAAHAMTQAERIAAALGSASFRPYASDDPTGVQIGGALKNVVAIAAGIVAGKGLGASARAALTARGFAELNRLGRALGANPSTLMGLSGLGDLVLSATSAKSRNYALGVGIGQGQPIEALTGAGAKLAEGAYTASVAIELAAAHGVDMPISTAVAAVLAGQLNVDAAVENLMSRPLRREGP
jgi:glycerol-3-phosphate dehydrogenase (NAD(P)+)